MATFYSNRYTYEAATGSYIANHPNVQQQGSPIYFSGTFTIPAALVAADVGNLCELPQNARLIDFRWYNDDCGGTITTSLTLVSTDLKTGIAMGTAVANTGMLALAATELGTAWGVPTAANNTLKFSFPTATTPTAGSVITWAVGFYLP